MSTHNPATPGAHPAPGDIDLVEPIRPLDRARAFANRFPDWAWLVLIVLLFLGAALMVAAAGGVNRLNPTLMLVPTVIAAWRFGMPGGLIGGLAAGALVGPWMPAAPGTDQATTDWAIRFALYTALGGLIGLFVKVESQHRNRTRVERDRIETLRQFDLTILESRHRDELFGGLTATLWQVPGLYGVAFYHAEQGEPLRLRLCSTGTVPAAFHRASGRERLDAMAARWLERAISSDAEPVPDALETFEGHAVLPLPLVTNDAVLGIAIAFVDRERTSLPFMRVVRNQLLIGLESWSNREAVRATQRRALFQLAVLSEARDGFDEAHIRRVGGYARVLAEHLGSSATRIEEISQGATVHDVGKIRVPEQILNKAGPLTEEEFRAVKQHAPGGAEILSFVGLSTGARIARHHHERWDGGGYPDGLKGEQIPYCARIVAVADVYDALTSARPYKNPWPQEDALAEIAAKRETQFAPDVVDAFQACWNAGRIRASKLPLPGGAP